MSLDFMSLVLSLIPEQLDILCEWDQQDHSKTASVLNKPSVTSGSQDVLWITIYIWVYLEQHEGESMPENSFWFNYSFKC